MKYKLKKWYPSLPKDWEVGMEIGQGDRGAFGDYSPCSSKYRNYYIPMCDVQDYPEFWEKVVEQDYEILSFKQDSLQTDLWTKFGDLWDRNVNGQCVTTPYTTEDMLKNPLYVIHSVKRLNDGEIFTIGDVVDGTFYKNITINSIDVNPDCTTQVQINHKDEGINLLTAKKVKQPLFTTHDNVDIYEGDTYHSIWFESFSYVGNYVAEVINSRFSNENCKTFSTKEKALDYIAMNKPCLSIEDVLHFLEKDFSANWKYDRTTNIVLGKFKELVKSKL